MYISFGCEREPHMMYSYINGQGIENFKIVKSRKDSLRNSNRYYIEKKGEIIVTILEVCNSKLFRFILNSIFFIISIIFLSGSDFEDYFSLKFNKGKLVLRILSYNLDDEIDIRQIMKNPPFNVETIHSYDNFSCEIIYNGRFEGKYALEEDKIAGFERKKKRKS